MNKKSDGDVGGNMRVEVQPKLVRWARERSGISFDKLAEKFPHLDEWEKGGEKPTLKQLERFAKTTHTPIGFLFLHEPPVEQLPIPDFRTIGNKHIGRSSPDLLETVYICQQRQEWYADFARSMKDSPFAFVGSAKTTSSIEITADAIRKALKFDLEERRQCPTWTDALRRFIEQADAMGVLVMVNGVVGNNNYRKLDPEEFRGFALADGLAPLIFVNGSDSKAAQMFTLAHELAHLWLGQTALSDVSPITETSQRVEQWCNKVAAELLVPLAALKAQYNKKADLTKELQRLAKHFKVSTLVILRRIHDAGGLTAKQLHKAYEEELDRIRALPRGSGGDFYLTQGARVGKRFARALISSTLEGQTLHRDAFRLLGFSKLSTFRELGNSLGVA